MVDTEISIRLATEADRPRLVALVAELQAYELRFERNRSAPDAMKAPYLAEIWDWATARGGALFVACAGADVVGFALCGVGSGGIDNLPEYERIGRITDIVVAEDRRGQGAGKALVRACEAHLRAGGALRIEIAAMARNDAARAAYEALGYRVSYVVLERYLGGPLAEDG